MSSNSPFVPEAGEDSPRTVPSQYLEGEDASDAERGGDRTALDDAISDTVDAQRLLLTSKVGAAGHRAPPVRQAQQYLLAHPFLDHPQELLVSSLFALGQAGVVVVDDDRGPLFRALWCVKLPPPSDTSVTPKIAIRSHDRCSLRPHQSRRMAPSYPL